MYLVCLSTENDKYDIERSRVTRRLGNFELGDVGGKLEVRKP